MDDSGESVHPAKPSRIEELGVPIQIVKIDEYDNEADEGKHNDFYLDVEALTKIMEDERIRDKPLCIVSVAGIISSRQAI
jgi:hypothetical protein